MCGIIGMAGNINHNHKQMLRDMFHVCELRGQDSTGMFTVRNGTKEPEVSKIAGATRDFFETKAWDKLSLFDKRVVIGHCRKATVGGISRATAHPFTHDHITGVHNGTLRNWRDLPAETLATDSTTLFNNLAQFGTKDTFEAVDGAYATIWWDENDDTLNVLRNKERPLSYALSEKGDALFFASEAWMITMNADRHDVKLMDLTPKEEYTTRTLQVEVDTHWRVRCKNASVDPLIFLEESELKGGVNLPKKELPFRQPWTGSYQSQRGTWRNGAWVAPTPTRVVDEPAKAGESASTPNLSSTTPKTDTALAITDSRISRPTLSLASNNSGAGSVSSKPSDQLNDSLKNLFGSELIGHNGLPMTQTEFEKTCYSDCQWCQKTFEYDDLNNGSLGDWIDDDRFLCVDCIAEEPTLVQQCQ